MVLRESEVNQWLKDQKLLLIREHDEKCLMRACKKRLKTIDKALFRNNELLRKR